MRHLRWLLATLLVGFIVPFMFADLLLLPRDLYYLLYFASVFGFSRYYARRTDLDISVLVRRRLVRAIAFGIVAGAILVQGVLTQPATPKLTGAVFWWALLWRGLLYGVVDGLLLFALPWTMTWRALDTERAGMGRKMLATAVAWLVTVIVTTVYHLGYGDFRSSKILQPNIGSAIAATATLAAGNPIASPIAHVFLHVAAVIHTPDTDLFLPPHGE